MEYTVEVKSNGGWTRHSMSSFEDLALERQVREAHLKSAVATADYWKRASIKVPTQGTAKFGPFRISWIDGGIQVKEGSTLVYFVPAS